MAPGGQRHAGPAQALHRAWAVAQDAVAAFFGNGGLRQASGLAFYTLLALIPALLLLTWILGLVTSGSLGAQQKLSQYLASMTPDQAERVLAEVAGLTRQPRAAGLLNTLLLAWSIVPLVSALRGSIGDIFKAQETRALWITKLLDLAAAMVALTALAALAGVEVLLRMLNAALLGSATPPVSLGFVLPFTVTTALVMAILHMFAPRDLRPAHLLAGSLATASLWFLMRPAFTLFLTYDRSFGLAFGSFKSLFIIFIWIYVSMIVLLLGAEVAAACHRGDAVAIKRLMEGRWSPDFAGHRNLLMEVGEGHVFFREGEPGEEMYHLLEGAVAVRKGGRELARIGPGGFFGEMTFLLGQDRSATAVATAPCRCVVVHGHNFDLLLREFPETVRTMLEVMASRLRDTSSRPVGAEPESEPELAETP